MKSFTSSLVVAMLVAGSWAVNVGRRQDTTTINGDGQGNSGGAVVIINGTPIYGTPTPTPATPTPTTPTPTSSADQSAITSNGSGNSGGAIVSINEGNGNGASQTSSAPTSSTSHAAAMGMGPGPTLMPLLAGGVLAAAANAILYL